MPQKNPAKKTTSSSLKILIANGVNLDLLGRREPEIYGSDTLADIEQLLRDQLKNLTTSAGLTRPIELHFFQTNNEADFLQQLSAGWAGAVVNAGAWTHTSLAIADRLAGLQLPYVEVHLSNLAKREAFRHHSYLAAGACGVVGGFGADSYLSGLLGLLRWLAKSR